MAAYWALSVIDRSMRLPVLEPVALVEVVAMAAMAATCKGRAVAVGAAAVVDAAVRTQHTDMGTCLRMDLRTGMGQIPAETLMTASAGLPAALTTALAWAGRRVAQTAIAT